MGLFFKSLGAVICLSVFITGCTGQRPDTIGVRNGRLAPCPDTPNCVASQDADEKHHIEAISYKTSKAEAFARLRQIVSSRKRVTLIQESNDYLHAEFRSRIMRFADDVEFYLPDGEPVIHVRSASRVGYSDLGANRKRIEHIRSLFKASP